MILSIVRILKPTTLLLTLFCSSTNLSLAVSGNSQSLQSIRMQAEDFILQYAYETPYPPGFEVSQIDSRLRLEACPYPLLFEFSNRQKTQGNTALIVRCELNAGWKLILPVRIDIYDDVLVANKALHKGQIIDGHQVRYQKQNVSRLNNGYYSKGDDLSGLEVRRNLKRGAILTPGSLQSRLMVKSGQQVTLVLDYKGLQIKSSGQALQSARRGEVIKVRNNQSNRIIEGIVSGDAQVRVNI